MKGAASWWPGYSRNPAARTQLLCFPYAGGSASAYRTWIPKLSPGVEVATLELPGRAQRFGEAALSTLSQAVPAIADACEQVLDSRPFAFFGHSLGGLLAFEVAHEMARRGGRLPSLLFLSGRGPKPDNEVVSDLPRDKLLKRLHSYGGLPQEAMANDELMDLVLPMIRADLAIAESSIGVGRTPMSVPIVAFGGDNDEELPPAELDNWRAHTSREFHSHVFDGDHFFIRPHEDRLLTIIRDQLRAIA